MTSVTLGDDNTLTEAGAFYEGLSGTFDASEPLAWSFIIEGVAESRVPEVISELSSVGFSSVEVPDDGEEQGLFSVWCSETRVHTKESFAARVSEMERIAARHNATVGDYSAGVSDAL